MEIKEINDKNNYTYNDVEEALASGDFSKFKGKFENEILDIKIAPYDFISSKEEKELCKDVSSFANSKGGFIVIGVAESSLENLPHKIIGEVVGVDIKKIDAQKYTQILHNNIVPKINSDTFGLKFGKLNKKDVFYIKILKSNEINVTVTPLPPYDGEQVFSGLVGTFSIKTDLENMAVEAGDTITLTIEISGKGNIMDAGMPEIQSNYMGPVVNKGSINAATFGRLTLSLERIRRLDGLFSAKSSREGCSS